MADVIYATQKGLRREAGLQQLHFADALSGTADGSNKVFYTRRKPIVDNDGDDIVTVTDVIVYVDDVVVVVKGIDPNAGKLTLDLAPANGASVTADYATSAADDEEINDYADEAVDYVDTFIKRFVTLPFEDEYAPGLIRTATRLYGAGLMLIRDYGSSTDTDLTSKDGYKKIDQANKLLQTYVDNQETSDAESADNQEVSVRSDGNIYERITDFDAEQFDDDSKDDWFMRRDR